MGKTTDNNPAIALTILYAKNEKIYPAYLSKQNSKRENHDSIQIRMALYSSKKAIYIIKRNIVKT